MTIAQEVLVKINQPLEEDVKAFLAAIKTWLKKNDLVRAVGEVLKFLVDYPGAKMTLQKSRADWEFVQELQSLRGTELTAKTETDAFKERLEDAVAVLAGYRKR